MQGTCLKAREHDREDFGVGSGGSSLLPPKILDLVWTNDVKSNMFPGGVLKILDIFWEVSHHLSNRLLLLDPALHAS